MLYRQVRGRGVRSSAGFEALEGRRLLSDGFAIDPTYGTGGKTTIGAVAEAADYVTRLMTTPAGKLLVLGSTGDTTPVAHLTQFNLDGTIDSGFGGGGRKLLTEFGTGAGAVDAVVGSDGRITVMRSGGGLNLKRFLADGTLDTSFAPPTFTTGSARDLAFSTDGAKYYAVVGTTISRLNATTGGYDTTFDGDGQITIPQEANSVQFTPTVVQPLADGSILVGGPYGNVLQGVRRAAFRHYNANGSFDAAFGTLSAAPLGNTSTPGRLVLQPDGKVVAVIADVVSGSTQGYVMRISAPVAGSAGTFDPGFATGSGLFTPNFSTMYEAVGDVELDANGRLTGTALGYASGGTTQETALFRLNADGTLDTTFGGAGTGYKRHVYDGGAAAIDWGPRELVINASTARVYTATSIRGIASAVEDQYLERFTLAGDVDTTFGSAGKVRTSYDLPQVERISAARALADDSVVFVGNVTPDAGVAVVAKLNPDGSRAAFGTNGVATVGFGSRSSYLWDVAAAPGGKLVAVGRASFYTSNWVDDFALARFNADGTLDTSFGTGGKVVTGFSGGDFEQFNKVFVAADGTIYAAGVYQTLGTGGVRTGAIVRYTPTGQVDTSFGTGGILKLTTLFADSPTTFVAHVELVGGKLLIAGTHEYGTASAQDSYLARLGLNGAPDAAFGSGGVVRYHLGADGYPGVVRLVTDAAAGRYYTLDLAKDANYVDHAYVRRYTLDGQLDTAWGAGGTATVTTADALSDLDVLADGRVRLTGTRVVSTSSTATNNKDLVFVGLTAAGALDLDFGVDGFQAMNLTKYDGGAALLPVAGGKFVVAGTYDPTGSDVDFLAVRVTGGADVAPPKLASAAPAQTRRAIVVQFSESVLASLTKSDLTVRRYDYFGPNAISAADFTFEAVDVDGATRVTITLAPTVADGDFDVYIPAGAVADPQGNATTTYLLTGKVFFLAGDATHDRVVNFDDLLVLAKNYNKTGVTFDQGDFTYDGVVNFDDLLILAKNYNKTVPLAGPAVEAAPLGAAALAAQLGVAVPPPTTTSTAPLRVAKLAPVPRPAVPPVKVPAPATKKAGSLFSETPVVVGKPQVAKPAVRRAK